MMNMRRRQTMNELHTHPESYQDGIGDYFGQTPPSPQTPWSHFHEGSDDSGCIESTPFQQSSIINSDHDTHEDSSFKNISSIEMELIYDLKAHMEQLYREMSELRQSLKSCMGMQVNMKNFIREEISAAWREEKKVGGKKIRKKGNCSICNEKKVDTLLYRCGRMCTCYNCAQELQWSSGKWPVCRLEIADVVRAYPDA
ncbi:neuralized-like protein [Drosera capensis]